MSKHRPPKDDPLARLHEKSKATVGTPPPTKVVPDKHKLKDVLPRHKVPDWKRGQDFE